MSKLILALSCAALSVGMIADPAFAASSDEQTPAVAKALLSGDFVSAETQIAQQGAGASSDPVALINLGNAYAGMGRRADAQLAYRAAIKADPNVELDMADGSVRTVREVATTAMQRLGTDYAVR